MPYSWIGQAMDAIFLDRPGYGYHIPGYGCHIVDPRLSEHLRALHLSWL